MTTLQASGRSSRSRCAAPSTVTTAAPGQAASGAGKTTLSQAATTQVQRAARPAGSRAASACSQREAGRIWRAFGLRPKRASQVPWCGVPSVTAWCRRASPPCAAHQQRSASPPMLCATTSGDTPVQASRRCTPASMARTVSSMRPSTGSRSTATTGTPWARRHAIQPFHSPRLHR